MKKNLNVMKVMLAIIFMTISFSAGAADNCSKIVDYMCIAFSKMAKEVDNCKTLNQLNSMDFNFALQGMDEDLGSLPESCLQYNLTKDDKSKLKKSFNEFYDTLVNKLYVFTDGVLSKEEIRGEMNSTIGNIIVIIDNSDTVDELFTRLQGI